MFPTNNDGAGSGTMPARAAAAARHLPGHRPRHLPGHRVELACARSRRTARSALADGAEQAGADAVHARDEICIALVALAQDALVALLLAFAQSVALVDDRAQFAGVELAATEQTELVGDAGVQKVLAGLFAQFRRQVECRLAALCVQLLGDTASLIALNQTVALVILESCNRHTLMSNRSTLGDIHIRIRHVITL